MIGRYFIEKECGDDGVHSMGKREGLDEVVKCE